MSLPSQTLTSWLRLGQDVWVIVLNQNTTVGEGSGIEGTEVSSSHHSIIPVFHYSINGCLCKESEGFPSLSLLKIKTLLFFTDILEIRIDDIFLGFLSRTFLRPSFRTGSGSSFLRSLCIHRLCQFMGRTGQFLFGGFYGAQVV
jgi:hypothetical protein